MLFFSHDIKSVQFCYTNTIMITLTQVSLLAIIKNKKRFMFRFKTLEFKTKKKQLISTSLLKCLLMLILDRVM